MTSSFLAAGARLSFSDTGTGVPVVFLHPTPLDHDFWRPLVAELPGIRAIAPDLRGHGTSELGSLLPVGGFARVPDASVLTMSRLAADTVALLDHLHVNEIIFVGCSIGGYVLLELWRQAPRRIRGLAIICSKPQPDAEANLAKRAATIALARAGGVAALFDGMTQSLIGATAREQRPQIASELRAHMKLSPEALVAVQAGLATRPDSLPTIATVEVPILAIAGAEDATVTPAEMEAFRPAPGGCQYHVLPNSGHFAAYEHPSEVAALLRPWLKQFVK